MRPVDETEFPPPGFSPTVSFVPNATGTEVSPINAHMAITAMRGKYRRQVNEIRRTYAKFRDPAEAKRAVAPLKKKLPGIMWSGTFSARGDRNLTEYSGLLCADLDHLDEGVIQSTLLAMRNDPHVWCAFRSPTDTGIKAVFRVGGGADDHRGNFLAVKLHVAKVYKLDVDEACKNVERLCFVSFDPAAFYNNQAVPLQPVVAAEGNQGTADAMTTTENTCSQQDPARPVAVEILPTRQQIAGELLGPIDWTSGTEGFCQCPGQHLHTSANGVRDSKVMLSGAPTITCFHNSCRGLVNAVNYELRSRIGKAEKIRTAQSTSDGSKLESEYFYACQLEKLIPPVKTCGPTWYTFGEGSWNETAKSVYLPGAFSVLPPGGRTAYRANQILEHVEGVSQVPQEQFRGFNQFAADGTVMLNAANGIIKVSATGEIQLLSHDRQQLFTKRLAANYIEAGAPIFTRVLSEALPDPMDQALLQLCAGNFLYPDARHEVATISYGDPGSGKSTLAEAVCASIGKPLVPRLTLSQICDPRSYHVPKLRFAAVNLGTELDAIELDDSGIFKAVVSGEAIEARPIYGAPFTMQTSCKLWFLANCLPRFKHGTAAELRRMRFLRFEFRPPVKDVALKSALTAERDGIFRWMLAGLVELMNLSEIPLGGRQSRQVHDRFRISNDPIGSFVEARCTLAPAATTNKDLLKDSFRDYSEENELPTAIGDWLFRKLYERWPQLKEARIREDGTKRPRVISGIALKS